MTGKNPLERKNMRELAETVKALSEYRALLGEIKRKRSASLYGAAPIHRAHITAALLSDLESALCVITPDDRAARSFASDVEAFCGTAPALLLSRDLMFYDADGVSRELEQKRLGALFSVASGEKKIIVGSAEAFMLRTMPKDLLLSSALTLESSGSYDLPGICEALAEAGYERCGQIEGPGQFALRGGILDVFPANSEEPVRAEFFGDEIDLLSRFDVETQRRTDNIDRITILPAREAQPKMAEGGVPGFCAALTKAAERKNCPPELKKRLLADAERAEQGFLPSADRWMGFIYPFACGFDHLPENTVMICSDTPAVFAACDAFEKRQAEEIKDLLERGMLSPDKNGWGLSERAFTAFLKSRVFILMDTFLSANALEPQSILSVNAKQLSSCGNLETMLSDLEGYVGMNYCLFALTGSEASARSLTQILTEHGFDCVNDDAMAAEGKVCVLPSVLSEGFEYPSVGLAVLSLSTGKAKRRQRHGKTSAKNAIRSFDDLTPGDLVVHQYHGIGRFVSLERIQVENAWRDYLKIAFDNGDFLFVPATALHLVCKYIGAGEASNVKLSKLGGAGWEKTKARAKRSAQNLAKGLLELYAERQRAKGFAFDPDNDWQRGFEEAFEYEETEDQLICTQEIKADMQRPQPMDRLLCGDVGFGKTEVAFRAVMKCILSGKQAAILAPTTVLARQHYVNSVQRFSGYPIKIELLSRFRTPSQIKESVRMVKSGECDLVIGTHRLLQKDIAFKDLGLLVVDEEQRFGVTHKEKIKQMTKTVDVLTLTATPIPRTLNMALSGIRDMSVLEEAPQGRQPVQTYVMEYDENVIFDAIRRELARGGQVYYLHNRVESIERCAARIRRAFPDETIAAAHGKMNEEELSDIMNRMYGGEISVLVCTTIIEIGVDIANVNTLIIEDADCMGLSQLHQIRGRVGRSMRRAFAYFTYRRGKVLSEISQKRLSAIREFAEFGSGFKIAMRDLEIRGAGNLLGAEQSGHMMSVGYDMYLQLLSEATSELKGEKIPENADCTADILVSAGLPQAYIADPGTRIDIYRRIAGIADEDDFADMQDELCDRFGDIPRSVQVLLDIALLRARAAKLGISDISQKNGKLVFTLRTAEPEMIVALCARREFSGRLSVSAADKPTFVLKLRPDEDPLKAASETVNAYAKGAEGK